MRYLTKSRFKMALECPTKLYFTGKQAYANTNSGDAFMQALADGGFQVGELAKLMHPDGREVTAKGHEAALANTAVLLENKLEEATVFEAAVRFDSLFVRIDILKRNGTHFEVIEVKAKSYDPAEGFRGKRGGIKPAMLPYLQDVAFQVYVVRAAFPGATVSAALMMADKSARATVDQLSQKFKINRSGGGPRIDIAEGTDATTIGAPLLAKLDVTPLVEEILASPLVYPGGENLFEATVDHFARAYRDDVMLPPNLGAHCGRCEFRTGQPDPRSGFHTCWKAVTNWRDEDFADGTVLDLWKSLRKNEFIRLGIFSLRHVPADDLQVCEASERLTISQRQWMQVSGQWPGEGGYFLDRAGLARIAASWTYPLHFIDFETSRTAIPFHIGRRPYEQVAFQFSHHIMHADGTVAHAGQFIEARPGVFPNYAFVRALREQLRHDSGTILRWATHENSVLRDIWHQLDEDTQPPADREDLQTFILEITSDKLRTGTRNMVDLCKLAEHYYFHPLTRGSCSIKKVLPAVLGSSDLLRQRYAAATYGSPGGIASLNFTDWAWWQMDPGANHPTDPYKLLPPVDFGSGGGNGELLDVAGDDEGGDEREDEGGDALANGGAAMTAYARLQYELLGAAERAALTTALLKYCELDTLAMVMIWESWAAELR